MSETAKPIWCIYCGKRDVLVCVDCHASRADLRTIVDQPPPVATDEPAVWDIVIAELRSRSVKNAEAQPKQWLIDLVITDCEERDRIGLERYNTRLQVSNGRDCLIDWYQEALDGLVYAKQCVLRGLPVGGAYERQRALVLDLRAAIEVQRRAA